MHTNERITYLVQSYLNKTISKDEYKELSDWIVQSDFHEVEALFEASIPKQDDWYDGSVNFAEASVLKEIQHKIAQSEKRMFPYKRWTYYSAAAVLIFTLMLFRPWQKIGLISPDQVSDKIASIEDKGDDIDILTDAGGHLSFADGEVVTVSKQQKEFIDHEGVRYKFLADGGVRLESVDAAYSHQAKHTFFTNRGDRANIILADGTTVWLSSSSSLVYPTTFADDKRVVEVHGEAFFDVSHNPGKPFVVKSNNTEIEVLGTRFNMRAYPEVDFSETTLVSGSVRVKSKNNQRRLVPGQQAVVNKKGEVAVATANLQDVLSWQSDVYRFSNLTIEEILIELGRWYAIEGIDNHSALQERYTGVLSKGKQLSGILKQLETISAHRFIIKERRIVIMN
ncbi:FecR family protein [Sphingobacterium tabacisoli]|uniref:FecR family protein n=1 Tax=Sphingobacterium tabacisoli TaxID=2044855 RepID=A0ABW5L4A4_9SPHI|nr:FecR family protein [Sphingobacterium tabacisoli]